MPLNGCVVASHMSSRARRPSVGKEFWAIIGVGVALGALILTGHSNMHARFDSVDALNAAVRAAIEEAGKGAFISQEAMDTWIASWDSDAELPPPQSRSARVIQLT